MDWINDLADNITNISQYFKAYAALCRSSPIVATIITAFLFVVFFYTAINQLQSGYLLLREKLFGQEATFKTQLQVFLMFLLLPIIFSVLIVVGVGNQTGIKPYFYFVNQFDIQSNILSPIFRIGGPNYLVWKFDDENAIRSKLQRNNRILTYQLQYSKFKNFREKIFECENKSWYTSPGSLNGVYFWRVRAESKELSTNKCPGKRESSWSIPIQISSYDSNIKRIKEEGLLRVYFASSINPNFLRFGNNQGFEPKIIDEIANNLSTKFQRSNENKIQVDSIPVEKWSDLLLAPSHYQADMIISTITISKAREEQRGIQFSDSYYETEKALMAKPGSIDMNNESLIKLRTENNIEKPFIIGKNIARFFSGKTVGVQEDSTSKRNLDILNDLITNSDEKINIRQFSHIEHAINNLTAPLSDMDFVLTDTPYTYDSISRHCLKYTIIEIQEDNYPDEFDRNLRIERYGIAVRAGENELLEVINNTLRQLKEITTISPEGEINKYDELKKQSFNEYEEYKSQISQTTPCSF